jgi:3-oxoacyl-[acyl-carrier protein] reductase
MDLGIGGAFAVVVGGSRGLGRAVAVRLGQEGAKVAVIARSQGQLDKTIERARAAGSPDAFGVIGDMASGESVDRAFAQIGERWGALNILVNNAANSLGTQGRFEDLTDEVWQEAFNRITIGYARTIRAALPLLRRGEWGRIVNISSASTRMFSARLGIYNIAKAAVTRLSKHLSADLAPDRILVNTVSPGGIMVSGGNWGEAINKSFAELGLDPADPYHATELGVRRHGATAPKLNRYGLVEEYTSVVLFAASRTNSYMTGADINVDGGTDF